MTTLLSGRIHNIFIMLFAAYCITSFIGCNSKPSIKNEPEKFLVAHPLIKDTVIVTEYVADIHSVQNIELRAKAGGYLEAILVDEGELVKEGQVLFRISNQFYRNELAKAQATLNSLLAEIKAAEIELKNTKNLSEKNIIAVTELEKAEASLLSLHAKAEEAKANVAGAQLELSLSQIKAPFTGYVNRIPNKIGSLIEAGTLLTTISNNDAIYAYFNVSERDYLDFTESQNNAERQEVSLLMANHKAYGFKGVIETSESEIDRNTGTIAFRAKFPNPTHMLKHGSSGKVRLSRPLRNALMVPQKSTFEIQENIYVYQVLGDGLVAMKRIVPSITLPHYYVVSEGLSGEDLFVLDGIQRVKQGDHIEIESVSVEGLALNL